MPVTVSEAGDVAASDDSVRLPSRSATNLGIDTDAFATAGNVSWT